MIEKLLNFFFPNCCGFCGKKISKRYTCENCANIIEYYKGKVSARKDDDTYYDKCIGLFKYDGMAKNKMLELKFNDKRTIAKSFGEMAALRLKELNINADVIIPVPLSRLRLIERGYNQARLIAKYASEIINIKVDAKILQKIKNNSKQSSLPIKNRAKNVQDVYKVVNADRILGKEVLLFDDIFSTGATINECSRMLKKAGAKSVIAVTVLYSFKWKERGRRSCG